MLKVFSEYMRKTLVSIFFILFTALFSFKGLLAANVASDSDDILYIIMPLIPAMVKANQQASTQKAEAFGFKISVDKIDFGGFYSYKVNINKPSTKDIHCYIGQGEKSKLDDHDFCSVSNEYSGKVGQHDISRSSINHPSGDYFLTIITGDNQGLRSKSFHLPPKKPIYELFPPYYTTLNTVETTISAEPNTTIIINGKDSEIIPASGKIKIMLDTSGETGQKEFTIAVKDKTGLISEFTHSIKVKKLSNIDNIKLFPEKIQISIDDEIALDNRMEMLGLVLKASAFGFDKAIDAVVTYKNGSTETLSAIKLELEIQDENIVKITQTVRESSKGVARKIPILKGLTKGSTTLVAKLDNFKSNKISLLVSDNNNQYETNLEYLDKLGIKSAWAKGYTGKGKAIVIIESFGFDIHHPGVAGRIIHEACFATEVNIGHCEGGQVDPETGKVSWIGSGAAMTSSCDLIGDSCLHGTMVMGVAAADYGEVKGVAPEANLILIRANARPAAFKYVADQLIDQFDIVAVSNSYAAGGNCASEHYDEMQDSIDKIVASGVAVIASAGNNSSQTLIGNPACRNNVVSVGAVGGVGINTVSIFSNNNKDLDLLAPGQGLSSLKNNSQIRTDAGGTSSSAPFVAGAWAILKSAKPDASVSEILTALKSTGKAVLDTRRLLYDAAIYNVEEMNKLGSFEANSIIRLEKDTSPDYDQGSQHYKACIIENNQTFCFRATENNVDIQTYNNPVKDIVNLGKQVNGENLDCTITGGDFNCHSILNMESVNDFSRTFSYQCAVSNGLLICKATSEDDRDILETAKTLQDVKEIELLDRAACAIHGHEVSCWGSVAKFGIGNVPTGLTDPINLKVSKGLACLIDQKENGNQLYCWGRSAESIDLSKFNNLSSFSLYSTYVGRARKAVVCAIQDQAINCQGNYIPHAGFDLSQQWVENDLHSVAVNSHSICALGTSLECHYAKAVEQDTPVIINPRIQVDKAIDFLLNK